MRVDRRSPVLKYHQLRQILRGMERVLAGGYLLYKVERRYLAPDLENRRFEYVESTYRGGSCRVNGTLIPDGQL